MTLRRLTSLTGVTRATERISVTRISLLALVALLTTAILASGGDQAKTESAVERGDHEVLTFDGLTRPSRKVKLALRVSGVIATRPIEEGQQIKSGQLIAELDSELEKAALEVSRLKAESDHEIRAAEVNEKLKAYELKRMRELTSKNAASEHELQEAQFAAELTKVQTEAAHFQQKLRVQEFRRDEVALAQRRVVAPFDGFVWKTLKEAHEAADALEPIAEVVKVDPLWVDLNVPAEHFGRIILGHTAGVTVVGRSRPGKVIAVDPLVDAGSATFRVKLEVANGDGAMVAGVPAAVRFELGKRLPAALTTQPQP